jgi:hypothetical protein
LDALEAYDKALNQFNLDSGAPDKFRINRFRLAAGAHLARST